MSLLPTPLSMPIMANGKILPINGLYGHQQQPNQTYLLLNPDRSLYPNYYLVYVPLIGSPSACTQVALPPMSPSILQASTLLNSLLTASSLFSTQSLPSVGPRRPNYISTSSSSIAFIRAQYRYNMRPTSYRYVQLLSNVDVLFALHCSYLS